MTRREYHVGPGAVSLLLIIVVVSMSILGLLSLSSARSDGKLTQRAAVLAAAEQQTAVRAEEALARLDAVLLRCAQDSADDEAYMSMISENLPENMSLDGRIVCWEQAAERGRTLKCSVEVLPYGSKERFAWKSHVFEADTGGDYSDMDFDVWE